MKIGELVRHEPFGDLLERTTSRFLALRFGGDWQVRWGRPDASALPDAQRWLVNFKINAIFQRDADAHVFDVVRKEFSSSPVRWKRPLQRLYFEAAVSRLFAESMAQAVVDIHPPMPRAKEWLIVGGSHKVRYIDVAEKKVYCCLKEGSRIEHFRREIDARNAARNEGVSVPRILEELSPECVVEEYVAGAPLNRLRSDTARKRCLDEVRASLEKLYSITARQETVAQHVANLCREIEGVLADCEALRPHRNTIEQLRHAAVDGLQDFRDVITTVQAHGDFQPGNLLCDGERVWIVDWEYSGRRQNDYDALVHDLGSRFPSGLAHRMRKSVAGTNGVTKQNDLRRLRIFLLEDLLFRCEEAKANPGAPAATSCIAFFKEAGEVLSVLREH